MPEGKRAQLFEAAMKSSRALCPLSFLASRASSTNSDEVVFIVDDDDAVRDSLRLFLQAYDCNTEEYSSIREFLRAYRPRERQCLVLDHHLPRETGLDFLESIDGAGLRLPVILMSGGGDCSLKERALKAGVIAYFDKPLNNSVLLATILTAIGKDAPS
jgi:FixJ family two-component response regulator